MLIVYYEHFFVVLVANLPGRQKARGREREPCEVAARGEEEEAPPGILSGCSCRKTPGVLTKGGAPPPPVINGL